MGHPDTRTYINIEDDLQFQDSRIQVPWSMLASDVTFQVLKRDKKSDVQQEPDEPSCEVSQIFWGNSENITSATEMQSNGAYEAVIEYHETRTYMNIIEEDLRVMLVLPMMVHWL